MSEHTFDVGDIVKSIGSETEFTVAGEDPAYPGMLRCEWDAFNGRQWSHFWPKNLTLVRTADGKEAPARQGFGIGDIVETKPPVGEMEVMGEAEGYPGMVLCRWTSAGNTFKLPFHPHNLTLVRKAGVMKP